MKVLIFFSTLLFSSLALACQCNDPHGMGYCGSNVCIPHHDIKLIPVKERECEPKKVVFKKACDC